MKIEPLISIIVPCYNVEEYLPRCIDSIINQTYLNLEILLVDDGSPDRCGEICDEYAKKDNRIRVMHKVNGGLSDARNVAIDFAKGDYISFIDSDDFVIPEYIETLYNLCLKYKTKLSVADWHIFPVGTNPTMNRHSFKEILFSRNGALEDMFNQRHFDVSACVKLYHRSLFEGVRYPKRMLFEDFQTTFKLILKCEEGVAYSDKQIYFYMFRPGSIEGSNFSEMKMDSALEVFNVMKSYESELHEVSDALKSRLSAFCFHLLLKMPENYKGRTVLENYIKEVRNTVVLNNKARMKTRLACASSYLGFNFTKMLFSFVDRRKG